LTVIGSGSVRSPEGNRLRKRCCGCNFFSVGSGTLVLRAWGVMDVGAGRCSKLLKFRQLQENLRFV
jgi:hypothetical protein